MYHVKGLACIETATLNIDPEQCKSHKSHIDSAMFPCIYLNIRKSI